MTEQKKTLPPPVEARHLTMAYGDTVIQKDISFAVKAGDVFVIMGNSGGGKSTLFRHLTGLERPREGQVLRDGKDIWHCGEADRKKAMLSSGILFQSGALWSSMTLTENIALPLQQFTNYSERQIADICDYNLALVGLAGRGKLYPSEISGGMKKRAGLARAMALNPNVLFLDEPSAGLDPVSARRLDELILELRNTLQTTFIVITHDLDSIFTIADDSIFLDGELHRMTARGKPADLRENCPDKGVRFFLRRGQ